jgi:hypothetical protein
VTRDVDGRGATRARAARRDARGDRAIAARVGEGRARARASARAREGDGDGCNANGNNAISDLARASIDARRVARYL